MVFVFLTMMLFGTKLLLQTKDTSLNASRYSNFNKSILKSISTGITTNIVFKETILIIFQSKLRHDGKSNSYLANFIAFLGKLRVFTDSKACKVWFDMSLVYKSAKVLIRYDSYCVKHVNESYRMSHTV